MYRLFLILSISIYPQFELAGQAILDFGPTQNMSITGISPEIDIAKNPYWALISLGLLEILERINFISE